MLAYAIILTSSNKIDVKNNKEARDTPYLRATRTMLSVPMDNRSFDVLVSSMWHSTLNHGCRHCDVGFHVLTQCHIAFHVRGSATSDRRRQCFHVRRWHCDAAFHVPA